MTLKEELEILRGEPIQVFDGDPMDIPCIETSDPDKLCKHPVVSVHMITYNHEPYIRQAIEGVMMQKTDFEFELIIGEDCSQDKTREICFEYQKKYPDKIRVLWWHENVSKLGGNSRRVRAHSRGEFIAFCEGDDYWLSSEKLQRQFNVFQMHKSVGFVTTHGIEVDAGGKYIRDLPIPLRGFVGRQVMLNKMLTSFWPGVLTCAVMCRYDVLCKNYDAISLLHRMRLRCGDVQRELATLYTHDAYFIPDKMVAYRKNPKSITGNVKSNFYVGRDGLLARYAYVCMTNMEHEKNFILKWYSNYMAESGLGILPFLKWLFWFVRSDKKFMIVARRARRMIKALFTK